MSATQEAAADLVVGQALAMADTLATRAGWWAAGDASPAFRSAAETFAAPRDPEDPGNVRVLYFPTGQSGVQEFLALLAFMVAFARANGYNGPVAWLSFPARLLGEAQVDALYRLEAEAGRLDLVPPQGLVAIENPGRRDTPIYVGALQPEASVAVNAPFAFRFGLPFVCIPSRSVSAMTFAYTPRR